MAYLVLVINTPNDSIAQLNSQVLLPTKAREVLSRLEDIVCAIEGGVKSGIVQVTVRDTDPGVTTSGTGSTQNTYSQR